MRVRLRPAVSLRHHRTAERGRFAGGVAIRARLRLACRLVRNFAYVHRVRDGRICAEIRLPAVRDVCYIYADI
jgi:hypothetical protein